MLLKKKKKINNNDPPSTRPASEVYTINILCIMFKITSFFMNTLFARLYLRVGVLLTWIKYLHDRIISLIGEVWAHITNL